MDRAVPQRTADALERDDFSSNRHPTLACCWSMIFSENRFHFSGSCSRSSWTSQIQFDPDWHVVGWFFPAARVLVDADRRLAVGGQRRQQQMVDSDACILLPGAGSVVPKRIDALGIGGRPHGFDEAEVQKGAEFRLGRRRAYPAAHPGGRASPA